MFLQKKWRILTVGDGDLSFSEALFYHHNPHQLVASVLDSKAELDQKYECHSYSQLSQSGVQVIDQFDLTQPHCWQSLAPALFDVVIFQFPLIPAFTSGESYRQVCRDISVNTLNRRLLRLFLIHASRYALDPKGAQLCYITSKDVSPYREWDIENSIHQGLDIHYLGRMPFDIEVFPGYQIRNVDRDSHVRDTNGITYVWSPNSSSSVATQLHQSEVMTGNVCAMCRAGPFMAEKDRLAHMASRRHRLMAEYQRQWELLLNDKNAW